MPTKIGIFYMLKSRFISMPECCMIFQISVKFLGLSFTILLFLCNQINHKITVEAFCLSTSAVKILIAVMQPHANSTAVIDIHHFHCRFRLSAFWIWIVWNITFYHLCDSGDYKLSLWVMDDYLTFKQCFWRIM